MRLKFIIIAVIALVAIACCASSCVENAQAQSSSSSSAYSIKRVHWEPFYDMKIYKVTTPTGTSYVLLEESSGGLCTLN